MTLDSFDRATLKIVQKDNQRTHADIGAEIGLSASAVRRRLASLRKRGVIRRDMALVDAGSTGVTLIVQIQFTEDSPEAYSAFDEKMNTLPNVQQSYHVSGSADYVLIVQGPSLSWYEDWAKLALMTDDSIRRHETAVAWSCKKFEPVVTFEDRS